MVFQSRAITSLACPVLCTSSLYHDDKFREENIVQVLLETPIFQYFHKVEKIKQLLRWDLKVFHPTLIVERAGCLVISVMKKKNLTFWANFWKPPNGLFAAWLSGSLFRCHRFDFHLLPCGISLEWILQHYKETRLV